MASTGELAKYSFITIAYQQHHKLTASPIRRNLGITLSYVCFTPPTKNRVELDVESYTRPDPATNERIALYRVAISIDRGKLDEAALNLWLAEAIAFNKISLLLLRPVSPVSFQVSRDLAATLGVSQVSLIIVLVGILEPQPLDSASSPNPYYGKANQ